MLQRSIGGPASPAPPRARFRRPGRLLAAAAVVLVSATFAGNAAADTYSCTGVDQTTTAPPGAQSAQIDLIGAAGGNSSTASGGDGAEVEATITVTPGEQLTVVVGCQGTLTAGGYGGGGAFGQSHTGSTTDNGAGGGGATAVLPASDDNFADAYAVAGGGGGGAAVGQVGGGGGGAADANGGGGGDDYTYGFGHIPRGGFFPGASGGASGDNGGAGADTRGPQQGTYEDYTGPNYGGVGSDGGNGTAGQGGAGGESYQGASSNDAGGGGGGGLTGGGGGAGGIESTSGADGAEYPSSGGGGGGGGSSGVQHGAAQIGTTGFTGSGDGSATITYVIQRSTSTSIGCSGIVQLGQATTCTATVTDTDTGTVSTPTGSVSFTANPGGSFSGGGSCTLAASGTSGVSSCQVTYSPTAAAGSESLTASAAGDVTHAPSSGQTTLSVGLRDTSTSAACSGARTVVGQAATCTVTVNDTSGGTASGPTGNVSFTSNAGGSFSDGGSCTLGASGTSGVSSCQVTYTPTTVGSGSHTITAAYAGDATHASSQSTTGISVAPGTLAIATGRASSRSGTVVDPGVTLSCPPGGPACTVTEQASTVLGAADAPIGPARGTRGPVSVASAQFSIPAGGSVEATFGLNPLGQTLVADHSQLPVEVTLSGQVGGGPPTLAIKQVVLTGSPARYGVSSVYLNRDGTLSLRVKVTSPGQVEVLLTAWKDNLATVARVLDPAPGRLVYGRATVTARHAGTFTIRIVPDRTGRRLLAHPAYRVTLRLWASYIPLYAFQTDAGYYGLHLGGGCASCRRRIWP
jgi:hypothetical protein